MTICQPLFKNLGYDTAITPSKRTVKLPLARNHPSCFVGIYYISIGIAQQHAVVLAKTKVLSQPRPFFQFNSLPPDLLCKHIFTLISAILINNQLRLEIVWLALYFSANLSVQFAPPPTVIILTGWAGFMMDNRHTDQIDLIQLLYLQGLDDELILSLFPQRPVVFDPMTYGGFPWVYISIILCYIILPSTFFHYIVQPSSIFSATVYLVICYFIRFSDFKPQYRQENIWARSVQSQVILAVTDAVLRGQFLTSDSMTVLRPKLRSIRWGGAERGLIGTESGKQGL